MNMARIVKVTLGPHFDEFIQAYIVSGRYNSVSEVVCASLRLLEVLINVESKYRVLSDTIFPEFSQVEPEGQFAKLFYKLRRRRSNAWKRSICYNDEGVKSFLNSLMSHIIKPKG